MQSLARFSTLQSSLVLKSSREFASTIKMQASALKAVSTRMEEVAEGDAIWDDDLTAGFVSCFSLASVFFYVLKFPISVYLIYFCVGSEKELQVSTQLQQLDNPFDPYGALSTPLYQTATFKQVSRKSFAMIFSMATLICLSFSLDVR